MLGFSLFVPALPRISTSAQKNVFSHLNLFIFWMYNKALNACSLGEQFCFPSSLNVSLETFGKTKLTVSLGTGH